MKKFLSLLSDPYLHVIGIGLVILALTSLGGDSDRKLASAETTPCTICKKVHEGDFSCAHVTTASSAPLTVRN